MFYNGDKLRNEACKSYTCLQSIIVLLLSTICTKQWLSSISKLRVASSRMCIAKLAKDVVLLLLWRMSCASMGSRHVKHKITLCRNDLKSRKIYMSVAQCWSIIVFYKSNKKNEKIKSWESTIDGVDLADCRTTNFASKMKIIIIFLGLLSFVLTKRLGTR